MAIVAAVIHGQQHSKNARGLNQFVYLQKKKKKTSRKTEDKECTRVCVVYTVCAYNMELSGECTDFNLAVKARCILCCMDVCCVYMLQYLIRRTPPSPLRTILGVVYSRIVRTTP